MLRRGDHVVVEQNANLSLGGLDPGVAGGRLADRPRLQHGEAERCLEAREHLGGAVAGAIVNDHQLEALGGQRLAE